MLSRPEKCRGFRPQMPTIPISSPITLHHILGTLDPFVVATGPSIAPIEHVRLFSPDHWESFVNEWATSLSEYAKVERASGAGDKGCDVVAMPIESESVWDNFQCKHYDHPLRPSDIWVELGKICYYTHIGEYSVPRRYRFVAPQDVGTSLASLFRKPNQLKAGLLTAWDTSCSNSIRTNTTIPLTLTLRAHIEGLDFSVFGYQPVLEMIEQHKNTPHYIARFGFGLPTRPTHAPPPDTLQSNETRYVQQLLAAYGDNRNTSFSNHFELLPNLQRHFNRSREFFYSAEALRNFSRDTLPEGTFEGLQSQVFDGVTLVERHSRFTTLIKVPSKALRNTQLNVSPVPWIL